MEFDTTASAPRLVQTKRRAYAKLGVANTADLTVT